MRKLSLTVVVVALSLALAATANGSPPKYMVTVLSSAGASGNSIDNLGFVAGFYTLANHTQHASLWAFGQQVDLGTLGSGTGLSSIVQWPVKNDRVLISGISLTDQLDPNKEGWSCGFFLPNPNFNVCLGFVWNPFTGQMRPLPTLGGTNGFATGTNNLGETVGWAENTVHDPTCVPPQVLQFRPVVWGPWDNEIRELPLIAGDSDGAATATNDRGQVVGISGACGFAVGGVSAKHAVLWENGMATEIVNPNGAPYWNTPMMINEQGVVVGFAGVPGDAAGNFTPSFIWSREEGWAFLPLLPGDIASVATSINGYRRSRRVFQQCQRQFPSVDLARWRDDESQRTHRAGVGADGPLLLAFDINDRGEITGTSATGQAFVAIPVRQ